MKKWLLPALTLALIGTSAPVSATVLFAGGEDSDFTIGGNVAVSTTATYFSSGYAREALEPALGSGGSAYPATQYALSPAFTANSTIWVHARYYGASGSETNNFEVVGLFSPDGVTRILVRNTGTAGEYKISTRNAAGTITDLVTMSSACFTGGPHAFDLYVNYGTSGEVTLYCSGVSYADYTGNVTTDSATQLDQVLLAQSSSNVSGTSSFWSEVIVSTTDTRNMRLVTLAPAANGNTDTWDTGGVSNVNETTDNTSTVNASGTAAEIQLYTVGSLPSGTWTVLDLWENMKAQVDTTGPQHVQAMVRTGSTNYTSSNLSPPQGSWGWISNDWPTNPNTSVAWTASDLGAAGFNLGFESQN